MYKILILLLSYFYVINSSTCRNVSSFCPSGQEMCGQWSGSCGCGCEKNYEIVCYMCESRYPSSCKYTPGICLMPSTPCPVSYSCGTVCINGTKIMEPVCTVCCDYGG